MKPKTCLILSLFLVGGAGAFALPSPPLSQAQESTSGESVPSQIEQIEKDLLEQQGELRNVDSKEKNILGEIERLEKDIVSQREAVRRVSNKIGDISREIKGGQTRIGQLNRGFLAAEERLRRRLVAFYKFGAPGYLSLLAKPATLQEFQKRAKYMKAIMDQDRQALDMLSRQRRWLEKELGLLKNNRAQGEALREDQNKRKALLEKDVEKKVLLLMKVHKEKEFYAKAVEELKEAADALNQTMRHLEREEKQRVLPGGFAEMKGGLPVPVKGKMLSGVKLSLANPYMQRKGVYINSAPGEGVRSVFGGQVDFSGWFKGYGQMMIVKHGYQYYTIYAHLDERAKEKGDMVSGGEVLGIVGNPGWDVGPGVYFEIRKGRQQLDPRTWLAIE